MDSRTPDGPNDETSLGSGVADTLLQSVVFALSEVHPQPVSSEIIARNLLRDSPSVDVDPVHFGAEVTDALGSLVVRGVVDTHDGWYILCSQAFETLRVMDLPV